MPEEIHVLTPGGYRARSLVHLVEAGHALVVADDAYRIQNLSNLRFVDIDKRGDEAAPPLGSGWITYGYWNNGSGKSLKRFVTKWTVPRPPSVIANPLQTIFLFSGIQNFGDNFGILQPVLQWGSSAAGGGDSWSIASWYVTSGGQAFHTPLVGVSPGDELVGIMEKTSGTDSRFSYLSEFENMAPTRLPVQNIAELLWFNETLEAYNIQRCENYPADPSTAFADIRIEADDSVMIPKWTINDRVTDCGQHATVSTNSQDRVQVFYRAEAAA